MSVCELSPAKARTYRSTLRARFLPKQSAPGTLQKTVALSQLTRSNAGSCAVLLTASPLDGVAGPLEANPALVVSLTRLRHAQQISALLFTRPCSYPRRHP